MALLLCVLPLLYGSLLFPSTSSRIWVYADVGHRDHIPLWGGDRSRAVLELCAPQGSSAPAPLCAAPRSSGPGVVLLVPAAICSSTTARGAAEVWRHLGWKSSPSLFSRALTVRDRHLQSAEMASLRSVISHLN